MYTNIGKNGDDHEWIKKETIIMINQRMNRQDITYDMAALVAYANRHILLLTGLVQEQVQERSGNICRSKRITLEATENRIELFHSRTKICRQSYHVSETGNHP